MAGTDLLVPAWWRLVSASSSAISAREEWEKFGAPLAGIASLQPSSSITSSVVPLSVSAASASSVNGLCAGVWSVVSVAGLVGEALSRLSSFVPSMLAETKVSTWERVPVHPSVSLLAPHQCCQL